jgi:hypothetical protein
VLGLPERFWVQAPINTVPTSLDGDGVIVQYINFRGGSVSMLYAGVVPLSAGDGPREQRASDTALDFAATLGDKYQRVDWSIFSGPVAVAPAPLKVDGVKVAAWRSKKYSTRPAAAYGGPTSVFTGELLMFHPPGSDKLAYVALDFKGGGTTLDKAIEHLSLKKTREVNPKGRRVQLLDLKESANDPSRFPVRLVAFDMPAGFVVTPDVLKLTGEWVYVEDRLDATGRRDAVLRIQQRPADGTKPLTQDRDDERAFYREEARPGERGPARGEGRDGLALRAPVAARRRGHARAHGRAAARRHDAAPHLDDLRRRRGARPRPRDDHRAPRVPRAHRPLVTHGPSPGRPAVLRESDAAGAGSRPAAAYHRGPRPRARRRSPWRRSARRSVRRS